MKSSPEPSARRALRIEPQQSPRAGYEAAAVDAAQLGTRTRDSLTSDDLLDAAHSVGPLLDAVIERLARGADWALALGHVLLPLAEATGDSFSVLALGGYADAMMNHGFLAFEDEAARHLVDLLDAVYRARLDRAPSPEVAQKLTEERGHFDEVMRRRLMRGCGGCGRKPPAKPRFPHELRFSNAIKDRAGSYFNHGTEVRAFVLPDGTEHPVGSCAANQVRQRPAGPGLRLRLAHEVRGCWHEYSTTFIFEHASALPLKVLCTDVSVSHANGYSTYTPRESWHDRVTLAFVDGLGLVHTSHQAR